MIEKTYNFEAYGSRSKLKTLTLEIKASSLAEARVKGVQEFKKQHHFEPEETQVEKVD